MKSSERILFEHRRRLAILEERIARRGDSAPIEWLTEADEIRVTIARQRLLRTLRKAVDAPQSMERVIDWYAVLERAKAALMAAVVILLLLLVFGFTR